MSKTTRTRMFDDLKAVLGDDGVAFKGTDFEASAAQRDYAQHFTEAIIRSDEDRSVNHCSPTSIVLIGSDTGTGKTVAYGVPLLLKAALNKAKGEPFKRVVIATHSHALQRQFLGTPENPGDISRIAGWLKSMGYPELRIARRMGRQAFISSSALEALIVRMKADRTELGLTAADFASLELLCDFAEQANEGKSSGLLEDIRESYGGRLPCGITASSIALSSDSDESDGMAYDIHLVMADAADVLIVTHAYLTSCAMYQNGKITDDGVDCLVIDESDRLADVAASAFRFDISLRRSVAALGRMPGESAKKAQVALEALANYTQSLHGRVEAVTLGELPAAAREHIVALAADAKKSITKVLATKSSQINKMELDDLNRYAVVLERFVASAQRQEQNRETAAGGKELFASAISFSPVKSLPSLMVMPLNPGRIISRLWSLRDDPQPGKPDHKTTPTNCVLLTSATLGAPGHYPDAVSRFRVIARELGVATTAQAYQQPELDLWSYFEPEKFGAVKFTLADPAVPSPTMGIDEESRAIINEAWRDYAVSMIAKAKAAGGRTLVLCNSYKDTQHLAEKLLEQGISAIEQVGGQSTRDCVDAFLADEQSVWLTPTAWEGLNLPGAISNLVIPRLPFYGASSVERALLKAYGLFTGKAIDAIISAGNMNATKRKLRQGMFRAIRSRTDKARIWIADPRFPLHPMSQIPLRHPSEVKYSGAKSYPALHVVIPTRFQRALENAEVLKMDGKLLK